jgi:hypothetical protein
LCKKKKKKEKKKKKKVAWQIGEERTAWNPGCYSLPLLLRATFEFGREGAQTEPRRPKKKKRNRKRKKGKEGEDGMADWPREDNVEPRSLQALTRKLS